MARPKSKLELVALSQANYQKLILYVNNFSAEQQISNFPQGTLNRNIRDVLAHIHHWHLMVLEWYKIGMKGEKPAMPAVGYTWKTVPDLNIHIQGKYADTPLTRIKLKLNDSFQAVQNLIDSHSNEELFQKKRYKWTGSTSLGSYLISATSSHYDWAFKLIKRAKKGEAK